METFILSMGWIGIYAPLALGAIGSSLDCARAEAARMREEAAKAIEAEKTAGLEALRLPARDAVLKLKAGITSSFEVFVKRLVTRATRDEELIKNLVLVLAGRAVDEGVAVAASRSAPAHDGRQ